ncbi:MAG: ATP-binding protein [Pleurocapsa sp.]
MAEAGKDYLTKIVGYNLRMKNLVDSLLTYARVTTKAEPFVRVALNEVISDVLYNLEPEIAQAQATLEVGDLPTIKGDRLQLNQLFLNLLQNALKFHSCDRLPQIKIEYHLEGDRHQIAIVDNGIGFEPEQQLKIFIPFHRLHGQSKYNGTGLGLAICTKIVHRHQGIITAASQPNKGTTFTISLPSNSL